MIIILCQRCGKKVKCKINNRKYCEDCARIIAWSKREEGKTKICHHCGELCYGYLCMKCHGATRNIKRVSRMGKVK